MGTSRGVHLFIMKIFAVLAASALAADFKCYMCDDESTTDQIETCGDDWIPEKSFVSPCSDKNGQHCFTYQRVNGDGSSIYQRGCQKKPEFAGFKEGCITTEDGTACYKSCTGETTEGNVTTLCNLDYDLATIINPPSSSTALTGSLALLVAYLFAQ